MKAVASPGSVNIIEQIENFNIIKYKLILEDSWEAHIYPYQQTIQITLPYKKDA